VSQISPADHVADSPIAYCFRMPQRTAGTTLALALAALPLVTMATGDGWQRVAASADDSYTSYVYPSSVRARGQLVEAWTLDDYAAPQPNDLSGTGGRYLSQETRWLFDCTHGTSTFTQVIRYSQHMGTGEVVGQGPVSEADQIMQHPLPRSVAAHQLKVVCEIWAKKAPQPAESNGTTAVL